MSLHVNPPALLTAAQIIAASVEQAGPPLDGEYGSMEASGRAAAAFGHAFDRYCAAFSRHLLAQSATLVETATSYSTMETANSTALEHVYPPGQP